MCRRWVAKVSSISIMAAVSVSLGACVSPPEQQLIRAARAGATDVVEGLLEAGVSPNVTTLEKDTPLNYAAFEGHTEIVRILLAAGADPNIQNERFGSTPLMNAANNGHIEVMRLLLAGGADLELRNNLEMTALWSTAAYGPKERARRAEAVALLVEAGAEVNTMAIPTPGVGNRVPVLTFPVVLGHFETVYVLIGAGADPNATDSAGVSPMDVARKIGNADMISLLEGKRFPDP